VSVPLGEQKYIGARTILVSRSSAGLFGLFRSSKWTNINLMSWRAIRYKGGPNGYNKSDAVNEVPRRTALSLGIAAIAGVAASSVTQAEGTPGGIKLTVLYGAPKDPAQFEKYYAETHMPMIYAIKEIKRPEIAIGLPGPGGSPPPFYRIFELWFSGAIPAGDGNSAVEEDRGGRAKLCLRWGDGLDLEDWMNAGALSRPL
jgi:uncharacterized protein (TIGR02118 family)